MKKSLLLRMNGFRAPWPLIQGPPSFTALSVIGADGVPLKLLGGVIMELEPVY
jgi:hypothetical protein